MRRPMALAGTALFFVCVPVVVAAVVPWWLTGWRAGRPWPGGLPLAVAGWALVVTGAAVLVPAFVRFAVEGLGTPAPPAPTQRLVVGGAYRFVRNPMYLAVEAAIVGQALLLRRPVLLLYAAAVALAVGSFVRWYEEPALRRQFGDEYDAYRAAVPRWLPRLTPGHWSRPAGRQPSGS
jgi:protein-S-isoprenylcysteine O-methyltransferase Ste14